MHFRNFGDLSASLAQWQDRLPRNITLICGVPRSGLMAASILALQMNRPLTDIDNLLQGRRFTAGARMGSSGASGALQPGQSILVVEDSVYRGASIREARDRLRSLEGLHTIRYGAAYVAPESQSLLDYWCEVLPMPRVFEWNLFHHPILESCCMDIDGILCRDPCEDENDDSVRYSKFLCSVSPRYIPTKKVGWLVTSRLEKYRNDTEKWLDNQGIKYGQLIMLNCPSAEERRRNQLSSAFKADVFKNSKAQLFIESDSKQAEVISKDSGKFVIATDTMSLIGPGGGAEIAARVRNRTRFYGRRMVGEWIQKAKRAMARLST